MRMLIVGAGALGGYYGAHLHRAGRDITFLVHLRRAEQIARDDLRIVSPNGDFAVPARTVLAGDIAAPFERFWWRPKPTHSSRRWTTSPRRSDRRP